MQTLTIVLLAVAIVAAVVFIAFSDGQKGLRSLSLKMLASFCFTLLGIAIVYQNGMSVAGMLFIFGFVASCFGDIVLGLPDMAEMKNKATTLTLIGGLCFAAAHACYIAGMVVLFGFAWWVVLIAVALGLVFFFGNKFIGKLNYGKLTLGMPVYSTFVSLVVGTSIMAFVNGSSTTGAVLLLVGFVLFWLSDMVLMNIYFGNKPDKKVFLYYFNLAFYYAAQILIALSLCFIL